MVTYEIHKKLRDDEIRSINLKHLKDNEISYSEILGLWYPVKYGIENMRTAVHVLSNFAFNNPEYVYRIVEVHYTTRSLTSKAKSNEN